MNRKSVNRPFRNHGSIEDEFVFEEVPDEKSKGNPKTSETVQRSLSEKSTARTPLAKDACALKDDEIDAMVAANTHAQPQMKSPGRRSHKRVGQHIASNPSVNPMKTKTVFIGGVKVANTRIHPQVEDEIRAHGIHVPTGMRTADLAIPSYDSIVTSSERHPLDCALFQEFSKDGANSPVDEMMRKSQPKNRRNRAGQERPKKDEKPSGKTGEKSGEKSSEKSSGKPSGKPGERRSENRNESRGEKSFRPNTEKTSEKSVEEKKNQRTETPQKENRPSSKKGVQKSAKTEAGNESAVQKPADAVSVPASASASAPISARAAQSAVQPAVSSVIPTVVPASVPPMTMVLPTTSAPVVTSMDAAMRGELLKQQEVLLNMIHQCHQTLATIQTQLLTPSAPISYVPAYSAFPIPPVVSAASEMTLPAEVGSSVTAGVADAAKNEDASSANPATERKLTHRERMWLKKQQAKSDSSDSTDVNGGSDSSKSEKVGKTERTDNAERTEKTERTVKAPELKGIGGKSEDEKSEKIKKPEGFEKLEKLEKTEKPEKLIKTEKGAKGEISSKSETGGKSEKAAKPSKVSKKDERLRVLQQSEFGKMGLSKELLFALDDAQYATPSRIQAEFIPEALKGDDLMGQAQTGTGKTAAFAIPILEMVEFDEDCFEPQAMVLVPTRELAVQVKDEFEKLAKYTDLECLALYGGKPLPPQVQQLKAGVDIVIGTPGRIMDHIKRGSLNLRNLKIAVLDEADRMLDIGFRPDIEKILRMAPQSRQTLLLSATIPPTVEAIARKYMREPKILDCSLKDISSETIEQFYFTVDPELKFDLLLKLIEREDPKQAIIFCRTKRGVERIANRLGKVIPSVESIHGDLQQRRRDRVMASFRSGKTRFLVATDVVGRGIDVTGISHIINYDIPKFCDDYVHRVGRTGRMGHEGVAFTFVAPEEGNELTRIEMRINRLLQRDEIRGFSNIIPPKTAEEVPSQRTEKTGAADRESEAPVHRRRRL